MQPFLSLAFFLLCHISAVSAGESRTSGLIAPGTRWETPCYRIESGEPGPTVVLVGGVHGDEPAGAQAAEQIRHWPLRKGRLVVIPRANRRALEAGTRFIPDAGRDSRDLNRDFPKPGDAGTATGELAAALWSCIAEQKPDWVIDLHEGYGFHQQGSKSVGSSIIDSNGAKADGMASTILAAINATIGHNDRKFVNLSLPVNGSLARAAAAHLGAASMILETTSGGGQCLSLRTRQHRVMVREFLVATGMMAAEQSAGMVAPEGSPGPRIALFDDEGMGGIGNLEETLHGIPDALVWRIGGEDIRGGSLAHFDAVVFPGGSGGRQAGALGEKGRSEVRRFVREGGGYGGICAGAYLAATNYPWSLGISDHQTFCETVDIPGKGSRSMWYRGESATVGMELSEAGRRLLGDRSGVMEVVYHNGPVMSAAGSADLPDYEVLAWFRSEIARYEPQKGTMTGTPAIISARYGKGRVLCVSPHPEATKALRPLLANGLRWVTGR